MSAFRAPSEPAYEYDDSECVCAICDSCAYCDAADLHAATAAPAPAPAAPAAHVGAPLTPCANCVNSENSMIQEPLFRVHFTLPFMLFILEAYFQGGWHHLLLPYLLVTVIYLLPVIVASIC